MTLDNWIEKYLLSTASSGVDELRQVVEQAVIEEREKLLAVFEECEAHCICDRNQYGFDYGEVHPKLGKPGIGKRWLTPSDIIDSLRARTPKQGGEK